MLVERLIKQNLVIAALLIAGCATPYYGYSKEEWQKPSGEEKKMAQKEYEEIIQLKYRQEHEDQFEQQKQKVINRGVMYE